MPKSAPTVRPGTEVVKFQEEQHPRDERGRWASKQGSLTRTGLIAALRASVRRRKIRDALSLDKQDKEQSRARRQQVLDKLRKELGRERNILSAKTHTDFINLGKEFLKSIPEIGELHRLEQEIGKFYDKDYGEDTETMIADMEKIDSIRGSQSNLYKTLDNTALKLKEKFLKDSPLSDEDAKKAADNLIFVDDGNGPSGVYFRHERAKKAAANFYRILGQPLNLLTQINTLGGKGRSSANNSNGHLNLRHDMSDRPLNHEMGHFVEFDHPELAMAANLFILSRAQGKAEKLSKLVPGSNYKDSEVALPDKFIHPYVGKSYPPDLVDSRQSGQPVAATEVISMALEAIMPLMQGEVTIASKEAFSSLVERDFEHFQFAIGVLQYVQAKSRQKVPHYGRLDEETELDGIDF